MAKNHPRKCLVCKKSFFAKNLRGVYCSAKCKVSENRKKKSNVTQNGGVALSEGDIELAKAMDVIEKEVAELSKIQNKIASIKYALNENELARQKKEIQEKKLLAQKREFIRLHGKPKSGGDFTRMGFEISENKSEKLFNVIIGRMLDSALNKHVVYYDYSSEINNIDLQLALLRKHAFVLFSPDIFKKSDFEKEAQIKAQHIESLKLEYKNLELEMSKRTSTKDVNQLKDDDGFVSAKDVKNISFADRIILSGDIGQFMGALEKDKCAITLTGKQGSGKTFFCFDLISKFIEKAFSVAYFSCEEGITQLTREKLIHYHLDNAENLKIKEQANLQDIQRAANNFDVIVIDSWGKLNADTSEFDKLRMSFPKTIIVAIFQLTSSGQMRGGTMAAFDAGVNIETSIVNGKRMAVCKKNRYGKTGVGYFIDGMVMEA